MCDLLEANVGKYLATQDWLRVYWNLWSYINFISSKVQKYEWFSLSKVKKIAEDFLAKYPAMFSANFEANKKSLDQLAVIPNRALRNQIAGAITKRVAAMAPEKSESDVALDDAVVEHAPVASETSTEPVAQEA